MLLPLKVTSSPLLSLCSFHSLRLVDAPIAGEGEYVKALSLESGYCFPNRANQEITAQLTACKLSIRKCELRKQAPDHEDQHGVGEGRHMIITGEGRLEFEEVVVSVTRVYEAHQSPAVLVVNQIIFDMNFIHNKADILTYM